MVGECSWLRYPLVAGVFFLKPIFRQNNRRKDMVWNVSMTSVFEEWLVLSSCIIQEHFLNRDLEQP